MSDFATIPYEEPLALLYQSRYSPPRSTTVPPLGASATARFKVRTGAATLPGLVSDPAGARNTAPAGTG